MRRSRAVPLTLAASASACAGAGAPPQALHCVERGTNHVVADSLCERAHVAENGGRSGTFGAATGSAGEFDEPVDTLSGGQTARGVVGYPSYRPSLLWYYGGRVANGVASGGGYDPARGVAYRSSSGFATTVGSARGFLGRIGGRLSGATRGGISRGGFGATGAAHASGG